MHRVIIYVQTAGTGTTLRAESTDRKKERKREKKKERKK